MLWYWGFTEIEDLGCVSSNHGQITLPKPHFIHLSDGMNDTFVIDLARLFIMGGKVESKMGNAL